MNCISALCIRHFSNLRGICRPLLAGLLLILSACVASAASEEKTSASDDAQSYDIVYTLRPDPSQDIVEVELRLRQSQSLLREVRMSLDSRISDVRAQGSLEASETGVRWRPPAAGGTMSWRVKIKHMRNNNGFDAWIAPKWALFRAEDAIPRAATRAVQGAYSNTKLAFDLPSGWSVVTQYPGKDRLLPVNNPERRFDQPTGWIVMGEIGVRRELIAGSEVVVAGPVNHSIRRMEVLALLNWTLPELARLLTDLPAHITIISAGEPMWRGGLSAPQSLYLHADRPLISENATSPLLHELMHIGLGIKSKKGFDWVVEGLAEYYSIELMRRSGTITQARYQAAMESQSKWARSASALCKPTSYGATTALAVSIFAGIDAEMRASPDSNVSLDDLTRALRIMQEPVGLEQLQSASKQLIGREPAALHVDKLPGCRTIDGDK
jgi:hypothetical protein